MANCICTHGRYSNITITQADGTIFLDTFGIYLGKIADMEYREKLLKELIPMQHEVEQSCLEYDDSEADEKINNGMEM